ncbi:DUF2142 domain-containing protein [Saccharothrix sp. NPDC042600]|uniref:DUF2142 domain-containing protein n=1 Tax=Saccharothrix TaxID=2071 RepID=UPI00340B0C2B
MTNRPSGVRLWLIAFIGFTLLHAAWAFAAPYDGPPDEEMHALRAAGVYNGSVIADETRSQTVPSSLDTNNAVENGVLVHRVCFPMKVNVPASCAEEPGGDQTLVDRYVTQARFNPVYYFAIGWPLKIWPEWRGIVGARLMNGALMAAMLACAVVAAVRWSRHRALLAGIVVAVTPMTAHLGGSINPNGLEITAGLCLAVSLIALLHERKDAEEVNRAAVALAAVSATVIVMPRFSGVLWLFVIGAAMLLPAKWQRVKTLVRARSVRIGLVAVALAGIASLAWTYFAKTASILGPDRNYPVKEVVKFALQDMWPNVVNQMIGVMGWAETLQPRLIYPVWFAAFGALVIGALIVGTRVDRWRVVLLFLGTFVPLLGAELFFLDQIGWFSQGRYFLPGAITIPVLAAHVLAKNALTAEHFRSATRIFALLLLPIHLVCVPWTMIRWQSGFAIMNPFKGSWVPPYGHVVPLASALLGVLVLGVMYWWASRLPSVPAVADEGPEQPESTETVEKVPVTSGTA